MDFYDENPLNHAHTWHADFLAIEKKCQLVRLHVEGKTVRQIATEMELELHVVEACFNRDWFYYVQAGFAHGLGGIGSERWDEYEDDE